MANTTFSGPVRSENGFCCAVLTETSPLTNCTHSGRAVDRLPTVRRDNTYTLHHSLSAGSYFSFVYGGGAADATDFIVDTGSDTNFVHSRGVTFHDTDDGAVSVVHIGRQRKLFKLAG
jgi:hypothetical protein